MLPPEDWGTIPTVSAERKLHNGGGEYISKKIEQVQFTTISEGFYFLHLGFAKFAIPMAPALFFRRPWSCKWRVPLVLRRSDLICNGAPNHRSHGGPWLGIDTMVTPMVTLGGSHFKEPPRIWRIEGCHNSLTTSLRKVWGFDTLMVVGAGIGVSWLRWLALTLWVTGHSQSHHCLLWSLAGFWIIWDDVLVHSNLLHPWDMWLCMLILRTSFDTEEVPVNLLRYVEISFTTWVNKIYICTGTFWTSVYNILFHHCLKSYFNTNCLKSTRLHPAVEVTPFASILRSVQLRAKQRETIMSTASRRCASVDFPHLIALVCEDLRHGIW